VVDAAPFAALRYDPSVAGDPASTSAPAYDVLERFTYARHRAASPYTVLELLTGEDDGTGEPYAAAGAAFERWVRTGVLITDPEPAYYLYEIHELRGGIPHVLRGVIAAVDVADGNLLPHEGVDAGRVAARARRMDVVPADLAPVFAVHTPAPPDMRAVVDGPPHAPPIVAFTDELGADHRVWALRDSAEIDIVRRGLAGVRAVIADGHHRHAAALLRRDRGPASARALTYLVDGTAYGPELLPVHRLVQPVPAGLEQRLAARFTISRPGPDEIDDLLRNEPGPAFGLWVAASDPVLISMRDDDQMRLPLVAGHSPAYARLDAAVWEDIVRPLLGPVTVGYRTDPAGAAAEVEAAGDAALFLLRPPSLEDVLASAGAGETLPPKSTWFRPKPRAGLVMRSLDSVR
jgi:hypothetical protein